MLCIELYEGKWYGGKWCDVHDELPRSTNATLQSVARRFWRQCRVYAEDGTVWQPRPADAFRLSFVRRILAEIGLDNPTCPIPMLYERVGQCSLADLKERLAAAVMAIASRHHQSARSVDDDEEGSISMIAPLDDIARAESFQEVARITWAFLSSLKDWTPESDWWWWP
jgi:hypothetical protein